MEVTTRIEKHTLKD